MRCLFITGNYKPAVNSGGPVNSVSSLAEALVQKGHLVTVLALNEDDGVPMDVVLYQAADVHGVSVVYFQRDHSTLDALRSSVMQVCRWEPAFYAWCQEHLAAFDWVHLQIGLLHPARWIAQFCKMQGLALAYHQRGNLDPRRFERWRFLKSLYIRWTEVPVLDQSDVLFALSQREGDVYRSWSQHARIERLPNGVDADYWGSEVDASTTSGKLAIQKDQRRVVWSARWDLRKGPIEFIETAKCVSKQLPNVQFVMLGPERGADLAVVEAAANAASLQNLSLIKGLDAEGRREQLQAADYFVLPTYGEGFSLGILEALAAGCVVLTTDEANFPELQDQCFGHILKRDPQLFANVLIEPLGDTKRIDAAVRSQAAAFVRENYDWSKIADRYIEIMESTLHK